MSDIATNQNISVEKDYPSQRNKKLWIIVIGITILIIFLVIGYILYSLQKSNTSSEIKTFLTQQIQAPIFTPISTPMPFVELTIPYLRQRDYKSTLRALEKISENANYTSYIASYDSDGLKINGLLTKPKGEEPLGGWPAIIFVHGYIPPRSYRTTVNYSSYVDYLARNGFVVFKIDLRGHDRSEGEPAGAYYSTDYIVDTLNARAALASSDFVNPDKIGLWGHSMAGNIVMRSMAVKPEIPAAVIWAGVVYSYTDVLKYGINDNSYQQSQASTQSAARRKQVFELYGDSSSDSPFWQQVASTTYLSDLKGAIQIHHALDDVAVTINYSRDLMALLDQTSVVHQLHEYASGGHNLTGSTFTQAMQRTVEFYKTHL